LFYFVEGRFEDALAEAWKMRVPENIYPIVMTAISAARLGRKEQAQNAIADVLRLKPDYADNVVRDLQNRNIVPDLIDLIVAGLRDAGLPYPTRPAGRSEARRETASVPRIVKAGA
jgi:adenylate cyclase